MSDQATILLVDDEPNVTESLKRALRREPYVFIAAGGAQEALRVFDEHRIDVIVSDERMPGMAGSELLAAVRKRSPQTIRMILSGQANLDAAIRAINEGEVYRFFLKPVAPAELILAIRQSLLQKRLQDRSRRLLREYQRQASLLAVLERDSPDLLRVDTDEQGAILVDESDAELPIEELLARMEQVMGTSVA